jgi:hypothetical protein
MTEHNQSAAAALAIIREGRRSGSRPTPDPATTLPAPVWGNPMQRENVQKYFAAQRRGPYCRPPAVPAPRAGSEKSIGRTPCTSPHQAPQLFRHLPGSTRGTPCNVRTHQNISPPSAAALTAGPLRRRPLGQARKNP